MPLPVTQPVSIASLSAQLADRIGLFAVDGTDYWNQAELDYHVRNAIREFQVITWYWRSRLNLPISTLTTPFYDLYDPVIGMIPRTVTDLDIMAQVGYHMLEYAGTGAPTPPFINTKQFTQLDVSAAFAEQIDWMLGESRLVVLEKIETGPPPPVGRLALAPAIIGVHRCEWQESLSGQWSLVSVTDDIGAYGWVNGWAQAPGVPRGYMVSAAPPLSLDLVPPPLNSGILSLISTISQGYVYTGTAQPLLIPDDAAYALTWGVLAAVLMQDAQSRDYARAVYAQRRFESAIKLLQEFPCVMQSWIGGIQQIPSTQYELDHWQPGWRNLPPGPAAQVAIVGRNLISVVPVLPTTANAIVLDCVANSPASVADRAAVFSVSNDIVTAILNNAQHAAAFKLMGVEFDNTLPLYKDFLETARLYVSQERAQVTNFDALMGTNAFENKNAPYELAGELVNG